jgi:hypothetical protein
MDQIIDGVCPQLRSADHSVRGIRVSPLVIHCINIAFVYDYFSVGDWWFLDIHFIAILII